VNTSNLLEIPKQFASKTVPLIFSSRPNVVFTLCRGSVLTAAMARPLHLQADRVRQHFHQDPLHGLDVHAARSGLFYDLIILKATVTQIECLFYS
jgi:hypothetical protein